MIDVFLRAESREALDTALTSAGLAAENGRPDAPDVRWSRIGKISRSTGEVDEEGLPIMEELPGYHANLRLLRQMSPAEEVALEPVTIAPPATPYRVWFD